MKNKAAKAEKNGEIENKEKEIQEQEMEQDATEVGAEENGQSGEEERIHDLEEKLGQANDKYVRLYSEYENYRRRTNAEKAELILNGGKDVLKAVLPIVDDMERALKALSDDNEAKQGLVLIHSKLLSTLQSKGVKPIEAINTKFDENLHEAVTRIPAASEEQKGMVIDEIERGYYINDKVLRYSKVVVSA